MNIRLGCGSWTDDEYKGLLYPPRLPKTRRLATYATWFNHIEVNATYHATQPAAVVANWEKQTPAGFTFSVKLARTFSEDPGAAAANGELVRKILESIRPLTQVEKLSALLLVLPPGFGPERNQLEELDALIEKMHPLPLAVELRHSAWVNDERRVATLDYFRDRKLVWVAVDMPRITGSTIMPVVDEVTHPRLAYLRLHGRNQGWLKAKSAAERHTYAYSAAELADIAARVKHLATNAECVHVIANNHARDFAPKTALELQRLLGLEIPRKPPDASELFLPLQ